MNSTVAPTVQIGATVGGQDTENVLEISSAKQKCEEMMKKFDIECEIKHDATGTGTVRTEEARAGNVNYRTRNQALSTGGRA